MLQFAQWGFWFGVAVTLTGITMWVFSKKAKTKEATLDWMVAGVGLTMYGLIPVLFYAAMWIAIAGSVSQ